MDYGLITIAATAIASARDLGKAAVGLRDFNQVSAAMSQINDQLLKAHDSLFAHNAQLHALQQENFSMTKRLQELEKQIADRARYTLFEISDQTYVLRSSNPTVLGSDLPHGSEPLHYACQPCMEKGIKSVLQKSSFYGSISLGCTICKQTFSTGKSEPFNT